MLKLLGKGITTVGIEVRRSIEREISFYKAAPMVATLILTYRCSSRCKTCTIWQRPRAGKKELELHDWKRIVEQLSQNNVGDVELFGGDVFLRKELLLPLIRFIKHKGMTIHMPTNANLLDQDTARELVEREVDFLYLSIDGVGRTQDLIRGVDGTFSRVCRALNFLTQARAGKTKPRLVCNTTVSNLNVDDLENIAAFAHQAGFDENHFEYVGEFNEQHVDQSIIDGIKPTPYYMQQGDSVLLNNEDAVRLKKTLWKIRHRYARTNLGVLTVNIDTLPVKDIHQGTIDNKKCYVIRTEVTVDPYGNLVPCMSFNNYFLGNLAQSDFADVWNNDKHRRFIKEQKSGRLRLCDHCILGVQRSHSFQMSLKRIYYTHFQNWYLNHLCRNTASSDPGETPLRIP